MNNIQKIQLKEIKKQNGFVGCFQTTDNYFKFCSMHNQTLQKAIQAQIDELDMTLVIE